MTKELLFISFNYSTAAIFNPKTNCINNTPLATLTNLTTKNNLVVCNKQLLNHIIPASTLSVATKDILYLYAALLPIKFTNSSIVGLTKALGLPLPSNLNSQATALYTIYNTLLTILSDFALPKQESILSISNFMDKNSTAWEWHHEIANTLAHVQLKNSNSEKVWKNFSNIETTKNYSTKSNNNISEELVLNTLSTLTKKYKKTRESQKKYALAVAKIFNNNNESTNKQPAREPKLESKTKIVFAEAGTGIGKTIGYLSAVIAFIKNNPNSSVVISTFSKALQQQIMQELNSNLDSNLHNIRANIIKGNQNYVCLLNIEYILHSIKNYPNGHIFLGLILRWLQETKNGDLLGGDFLPFLKDVIPKEIIDNILNKKDECLYAKCNHYKKCFITKIKEETKNSNIIISNHSLTLLNNFKSDYFIFDEAHSLYHVSDEIYSKELSANKAIFLKNWLTGSSSKFRSEKTLLNGLQARLNTILSFIENTSSYSSNTDINHNTNNTETEPTTEFQNEIIDLKIKKLISTLIYSCSFLPSNNYLINIKQHKPQGVFEDFLYNVYTHILLHNSDLDQYYSIESHPTNLSENFMQTAEKLLYQLYGTLKVALNLKEELTNKLEVTTKESKNTLIEFIASFEYNCIETLTTFVELLEELKKPYNNYIYRFSIVKEESVIANIGYFKNHINPLSAFSNNLVNGKQGIAFTSATLADNEKNNNNNDYYITKFALEQSKVEIISNITLKSPFNYTTNSKVIILNTNYSKNNSLRQEALLQFFLAAKGGVLAIFTSLARLKSNYNHLANNFLLKKSNIEVMAQLNKEKNSSSIINLFKENEDSCLLGSDSFRDGIDIPGKSLRMVIFEKVPWLRKNILNGARKAYFGKELEFENIRFKLRQAFGRIIRSEQDKGIFILLEPGLPSELLSAFPDNIEVHKISLEEAISLSKIFLEDYIK